MPERSEGIITQRIPAGALAPAEQVGSAFELVRAATAMLDLAAAPALLEGALADLTTPLVTLASAGVLVGVGLTLREGEEICSAVILLEHDGVGDAEAVDFSALRLLVGHEAAPSLEIICEDCALARKLVDRLLPRLAADTLAVAQIRWQAESPEVDLQAEDMLTDDAEEEDIDGNDDESENWR